MSYFSSNVSYYSGGYGSFRLALTSACSASISATMACEALKARDRCRVESVECTQGFQVQLAGCSDEAAVVTGADAVAPHYLAEFLLSCSRMAQRRLPFLSAAGGVKWESSWSSSTSRPLASKTFQTVSLMIRARLQSLR